MNRVWDKQRILEALRQLHKQGKDLSYNRLARSGYQHRRIHHAQEIYVMGDMHTNTIEGFWSLVKRGIAGTHHAVSAKWLPGLPERVRTALQPPRRRLGDVPDATSAVGDDQPVMVAWRPSLGRGRPAHAWAPGSCDLSVSPAWVRHPWTSDHRL